jgi:large subunit ribosomal protein L21e
VIGFFLRWSLTSRVCCFPRHSLFKRSVLRSGEASFTLAYGTFKRARLFATEHMVTRMGGFRRKTRNKLSKRPRERGKISIRRTLQEFKQGDRVALNAEPAQQSGMYHPRFHGKNGLVTERRGECYCVVIRDGGKEKTLIVHPVHLRRMK